MVPKIAGSILDDLVKLGFEKVTEWVINDGKLKLASLDWPENSGCWLSERPEVTTTAHYMAKAPLIGYRVRPTKDGKFTACKTRLPYVSHLRNFEILNSYSMAELLISSGEGVKIVSQIRQDQKRRLPPSPAVRAGSHSCYTGPSLRLG